VACALWIFPEVVREGEGIRATPCGVFKIDPRNEVQTILNERFALLTGQTLPVLRSARLEAAKPIRTLFTSCDPTYPDVILAFS